jgi:hypothetical protein
MEYAMISKFSNPLTKTISLLALAALLNACGSNNNESTSNSTKTVTELPLAALMVPNLNGLSAQIILDGDTASPIALTIDTTLHTATANIPGLSLASHTIQIIYRYTDSNGTITIAQSAVHTVDLSGGSATYDIPSGNYVTTGADFDADLDGLSNAYELAAGTNPRDASCVVGYSLLDSCTL